jgi:hypothetical protein
MPPPLLFSLAAPTGRDSCGGGGGAAAAEAAGPTTTTARPPFSPLPLERAVLVRLGRMAGKHAVARAAVARLLMHQQDDKDGAAAGFASSAAAAQQQPTAPHYTRTLFAELRAHPRVLGDDDPLAFLDDNINNHHDEAEVERLTLLALEPPPAPTPPPSLALCAGVLRFHAEAREAQARARLRALRSNDLGAYLALLRGTRDARLRECFEQTEMVLGRLLQRLPPSAASAAASAAAAARPVRRGAAAGGVPGQGGADDDEGGEEDEEGSRATAAWERLATRIGEQEDVREQPATLGSTGGGGGGGGGGEAGAGAGEEQHALKLRAYQMDGMRWMIGLKGLGLNGILADESGFFCCCCC